MTIFSEIAGPFQLRPFFFRSESIVRVGWLWFAAGWLRVPFRDFTETAYRWEVR